MPVVTPRLGIKKPLGNENVTREAFNENYDIIDANAAKKTEVDAASAAATTAKNAASAAQSTANSALARANASLPKDGSEDMTSHLTLQNGAGFFVRKTDGNRGNALLHRTTGNTIVLGDDSEVVYTWTGQRFWHEKNLVIGNASGNIPQRDSNGRLFANVLASTDTREVNSPPNYYPMGVQEEFKRGSVIGIPIETWLHVRTIRPWTDDSAGWTFQEAYGTQTGKKYVRRGNNTTWQAWGTEWDSTNDGNGSGLDAELLCGMTTSVNSEGNTIVARTSSGSINADTLYASSVGIGVPVYAKNPAGEIRLYPFNDGFDYIQTKNGLKLTGLDGQKSSKFSLDTNQFLFNGEIQPVFRFSNGYLEYLTETGWHSTGGIKKVQRGLYTHSTGDERTQTIGQVNPDKAYIIISYTGEYSTYAINSDIRARISSSTEIAFYKRSTNPVELQWQVIEFY
ncbi:pyocin knob domain-containing protein [Paenibacillus sp. UNC451MF]|uniref:pyocin knob domain-containing protein n=1 Tax=Paenibacillus sp. UNC451MF TaxID=1449063 RepID=UPI00048A9A42|nr:pyocin knob domain-containing protein [Paenibacillus sp. UNC451MF]